MKQYHLSLMLAGLLSIVASVAVEAQNSNRKPMSESTQALLNGSWKRIAVIQDGKPEAAPLEQIRLFHDGFYTYIGQDSAHNWTRTFGGTYELSGNTYKEMMRYCYLPAIVGNTHWQSFKIKGDTLRIKLFEKMMDSTGKEVPPPKYTRELVFTREKK